jgi:hypothetical protein
VTVENFKEACARSIDSIRKLIVANLKEEPIEEIVSAETLEPIIKAENEEVDTTENLLQAEKKLLPLVMKKSNKKTPLDIRPMCGKKVRDKQKNLYCTYEGCRKTFKLQKCLESHIKMHTAEKVRFNLICPFSLFLTYQSLL